MQTVLRFESAPTLTAPPEQNRPLVGYFFVSPTDKRVSLTLNTNQSGVVETKLVAGYLSGRACDRISRRRWTGRRRHGARRIRGSRIGPAERLDASRRVLDWGDDVHHQGDNFYVQDSVVQRLRLIADSMKGVVNSDSVFLQYNDASLPAGGTFTVYREPVVYEDPFKVEPEGHQAHNTGLDQDIGWCYSKHHGDDGGTLYRLFSSACSGTGGNTSLAVHFDRLQLVACAQHGAPLAHSTTITISDSWGLTMRFPVISARTSVTGLFFITALAYVSTERARAQAPTRLLNDVALETTSVAESSGYLVYRYRLSNSPLSRGAVAGVNIDLSGPRGTGLVVLPSTGEFINTTGFAVGPVTDHVPIGVITPDSWSAGLMPNAILHWGAVQGYSTDGTNAAPFTRDSAPAGGAKDGFGLRSSYYPGIRRFSAEPTLGSCCARPRAGSGEYPAAGEFRVRDATVAPAVRREDIALETVRSDLQQVCGSLRWIGDPLACGRFRSLLQDAISATRGRDAQGAKQALGSFLQDLDNHHGPGKPVNDNAYWLLKLNVEYLRRQL